MHLSSTQRPQSQPVGKSTDHREDGEPHESRLKELQKLPITKWPETDLVIIDDFLPVAYVQCVHRRMIRADLLQ